MSDKKTLIIVLLLVACLFIPTLVYPITGDSLAFVRDTNGFIEGTMPDDYKQSPILSSFSVPLALILGNTVLAVTLTAFIFGLVSIVAWYFIGKELFNDTRIFPFLILCPFLILFMAFRALSEAPLIAFSLLSLLFFFKARKNKNHFYLCGVFFGLASLSRYAGLVLGLSYVIYYIFRMERPSKKFALGLIIGLLIFSSVPIVNTINHGTPLPTAYMQKVAGGFVEESWLMRFFTYLPLQIVFVLVMIHIFIPNALNGLKKINKEIGLVVIIACLGIIFAAFSGRTWRYAVPMLPFLLILVFNGFKGSGSRVLRFLFVAGLIANILLVPFFVNGQAKDFADGYYEGPVVWGQVGLRDMNAISWANQNLPIHATLLIPHEYSSEDPIWDGYFREDIRVVGYAHMHKAPSTFYMYDGQGSDYVLSDALFVYPNGIVDFGKKPDFESMEEYINRRYKQTIIFQDEGLPTTSIILVEK